MSLTHIYPINDLQPHELTGTQCPCGPRVDWENQQVIHRSWDGRELAEEASAVTGARMVRSREVVSGYVPQAMWDEPNAAWFDLGRGLSGDVELCDTVPEAQRIIDEAKANFEQGRFKPECIRAGIRATRIVFRTVTDEPME